MPPASRMIASASRIAVPAVITSSTISTRAGQRRADQHAAFAVRLGFLAVEGQRQVAAAARVFAGQRGRQRDALVGRPEQHVEAEPARRRAHRRSSRPASASAAPESKRPGVEEIRAVAPGLERELAEAQRLARAARVRGNGVGGRCIVAAVGVDAGNAMMPAPYAGRVGGATRLGFGMAPSLRITRFMRIISFNANGLRSRRRARASSTGSPSRTPTCCACRKPRRRSTSSPTRPSCPTRLPRWFRDATHEEGLQRRRHLQPSASPTRCAPRWAGRLRRRGPLHRGALRQAQRGVVLHPVRFVGRRCARASSSRSWTGSSRSSPVAAQRPRLRAVRRLEHRAQPTGHPQLEVEPEELRLPAARARLAQRAVSTDSAAGSTPTARCMPKARTTPGGASAAPRAPTTSAGASTTSS